MNATDQALETVTDEGLFEVLATAILGEADSTYASLHQTGVNATGKPVKSPVDALCIVPGSDPPHLIVVQHTTSLRQALRKKWLHDSSTAKPRKGSQPTAPDGDLIKTAKLVAEERARTPTLRATLVLTTNREPDEELIRDVEAEGRPRE